MSRMTPNRRRHGGKQRIGLLAVVFALLLQAVAWAHIPAVSISGDDEIIVLCTSSGMKTMSLAELDSQLDPDQDRQDPGLQTSSGFCALCSLAHGLAILPETCTLPSADSIARMVRTPPAEALVLERFPTSHQARAPPGRA